MELSPLLEKRVRFTRRQITTRSEKLLIRGHDRDKSEWDDQADEYRSDNPQGATAKEPRGRTGKQTHYGQGSLHHRGARVARSPDGCGEFSAAPHSSRMLDSLYVYRRAV